MCQDDRVIDMEQLAHREWGAGQRPKGRAGIFQGRPHQILSQLGIGTFPPRVLSQANTKHRILSQLGIFACPLYVLSQALHCSKI